MDRARCTLHESLDPQALATVDLGLGVHNEGVAALAAVRPLAVIARDEHGDVVAGAVGRSWGACCELQQLWVAEERRGHGLGASVLRRFEAAARARGCTLLFLETFSFQAPRFYARIGYRTVHRIEGFGGGVVKHLLQKSLAAG